MANITADILSPEGELLHRDAGLEVAPRGQGWQATVRIGGDTSNLKPGAPVRVRIGDQALIEAEALGAYAIRGAGAPPA